MTEQSLCRPKVLLTTLTAKFIHSSLSLRYLYEACQNCDVELSLQEFHINLPPLSVLSAIDAQEPDVVGFSCYIWNIVQTLELADMLKRIRPNCWIVLGGPEVSYDSANLLRRNPAVDFVVRGEGEEALPMLLQSLPTAGRQGQPSSLDEGVLERIPGLVYRSKNSVRENPPAAIADLSQVRSPYASIGLDNLANKLVYVESSRGCPFSCAYCLSSKTRGVRFFPLDRVQEDIAKLVERGCKEIKFVDRTFNCRKDWAMKLWRYLRDLPGDSMFHFEIEAQLLDDEMLTFLESVPPGKFQFEIGIQTTTPRALSLIERRQDWDKLSVPIRRLASAGNIELHLDLIAGLPGDTLESFANALNMVYQLHPTRIQLGFLKVLKGSGLWESAEELGLVYQQSPPYEILATPDMSYRELAGLKQVEELVERYYNSHRFDAVLDFVVTHLYAGKAFSFFREFADFWSEHGLFTVGHKATGLYGYFYEFIRSRHEGYAACVQELLTYDFLSVEERRDLPAWAEEQLPFPHRELKCLDRARYYDLLSDEQWRSCYVPHLTGLPSREVDKRIRIARINLSDDRLGDSLNRYAWFVFDHSQIHPINKRAKATRLYDEI